MNSKTTILYLSNHQIPYRTRMFNLMAEGCELTVAYQGRDIQARDKMWVESEVPRHKALFMDEKHGSAPIVVGWQYMKLILSRKWDSVIIGCWNEKPQLMVMLLMRLLHKPFVMNLDGEYFLEGTSFKTRIKRFIIRGAEKYLVAGEVSSNELRKYVKSPVIPYWFSSLCDKEIAENSTADCDREDFVLVVGQYFDYKGMDVAFEAATLNTSIRYKFVGMGKRQELFLKKYDAKKAPNVEFIPFLQKKDLENEYQRCSVFVLPSRKECWGLVINEAASFGTPIVSTWGSGAAVEFLGTDYFKYLAEPDDAVSLLNCIQHCLSADNNAYSQYLKEKSRQYSIENSVKAHLNNL